MDAKTKSAKIIEVIEVMRCKGQGTDQDPGRIVTEYWSKEGKLLAVNDPYPDLCVDYPSLG